MLDIHAPCAYRSGMTLREARQKRKMTQQDLATESGVGQPVISRLERGRYKNMTLRTMQRLATALQMTLGEIEWEQGDAKV